MSRQCTLKGNPQKLAGPELKVGDAAPDATLRKDLVSDYKLSEHAGKPRIYSVVPSLDTPVCAIQTKKFNEQAADLTNVNFFTISFDLPVAQKRFCGAENIGDRMMALSDAKLGEFAEKYGTLIPDHRISCRAVFVVGPDDKIAYVEYVPEIAEEPNYDAVIEAAKKVAG